MEHLPPAALSPFRSLAKGLLILSLNPAVAQAHVPAAAADPASPPPALTVAADQVARHGITWHFDHPYPVGSFANGDPFVVGPVRIVAIDPRCEVVDGRTLHGSMVDPDPGRLEQGFDSALLGEWTADTYRQDRNVAHVLGRDRPLELGPDHSLVSVISEPQPDDKNGRIARLRTAAVLTCLAAVPARDSFRPPYTAGDKTLKYRKDQLDFRVLARLKPQVEVPPLEATSSKFEKLWLDYWPSWVARLMHPRETMPDYGRDMAAAVSSAALQLNLDATNVQKTELLVRLVQVGIDNYGALVAGTTWPGNGGHGSGRKFPILLAGAVLHDQKLLQVGHDFVSDYQPDGQSKAYFGEDAQTFFVTETSKGVFNWGFGDYDKQHVGLPEWGFAHASDPKSDTAKWDGNSYRLCCTANAWVGETLAVRVMGLQSAWNHPAFFDYMDRYLQATFQEPWHRAWIPWHAAVWDANRRKY